MITTHYMEEAERLCDRVAVMDQGHVVALDTPDRLIALHGPGTSIEFSSHDADEASMRALDGVASAHVSGTSVRLLTRSPETVLAQLLHPDAAGRDGMSNLRVEHGTLEDVFLALTGRGLELVKAWFALVKTTVRSSFRNRAALIFTLLIPIFLMVLLGNVLGGGNASVNIGVANHARTSLSTSYIGVLKRDKNLVVEQGSAATEFEPAPARRRRGGGGDPARFRDAVSCRSAMCRHRRQSPT